MHILVCIHLRKVEFLMEIPLSQEPEICSRLGEGRR